MRLKAVPAAWRDAFSFLTVFPSGTRAVSESPQDKIGRAMPWFPIVGAFIGAIGGLTAGLAFQWWDRSIAAVFGLASMVIITGGLHLDGLSDSLDGLAAWKGRDETLRIMRDSRIGAAGAIGLILALLLKWALISRLLLGNVAGALAVSCALSRFALVFSAYFFRAVPGRTGLGSAFVEAVNARAAWLAFGLAVLISAACAGPVRGLVAVAISAAAASAVNLFFVKRLGGVTGDTLGVVNESVEICVLLWLAFNHAGY